MASFLLSRVKQFKYQYLVIITLLTKCASLQNTRVNTTLIDADGIVAEIEELR